MKTLLKASFFMLCAALAVLGVLGIAAASTRVEAILSGTLLGLALAIAVLVPLALREHRY